MPWLPLLVRKQTEQPVAMPPAARPDVIPDRRPVWLNPLAVWLPLPGWLSILQRGSGVLLALLFPVLVWLLRVSLLTSQDSHFLVWLRTLQGRLLSAALVWLLVQHALGGLRFLLLEKGVATSLGQARWLSGFILGVAGLAGMVTLAVGF